MGRCGGACTNCCASGPRGSPRWRSKGCRWRAGWTVIDSDGTLIPAPSEKEGARGTYKGFLGHHIFVATCDNTGEQLAATLTRASSVPTTQA